MSNKIGKALYELLEVFKEIDLDNKNNNEKNQGYTYNSSTMKKKT